jgi:hypothetical protein
MGKVAILSLIAFAAIGAVRQSQQIGTRQHTEQRDAETRFEMLTRSAALFGFERAKQSLVAPWVPPSTTLADSFAQATRYQTDIRYSGGIATIRSTGLATDATGQVRHYKIVSRIQRELELPGAAPLFTQFALLSQSDLTLSGSILVDTFRVEGDTRAPSNANVHTNGTIRVNGASARVRGFGTYAVNKQVGQETKVFVPYSNPTGAEVLARTPAVTLPTFTPQGVAAALGADRTTTGGLSLSGTHDFTALGATRDNPFVWYVDGNVTVARNTLFKGYVVMAVKGNLDLSGGETIGLDNGFSESNAAWYTSGTISFSGNSEVWGQFYTSGNVVFSGTPRIYGSIATRATATISGNPSIYYIAPSSALTTYWQPPEVRLRRLSYSEGW